MFGNVVHRTFEPKTIAYVEPKGAYDKKPNQRKISIWAQGGAGQGLLSDIEAPLKAVCKDNGLDFEATLLQITKNDYLRFTPGYAQLRVLLGDKFVSTTIEELVKHKTVLVRELSAVVQHYPAHPEGRYPAGVSLKLLTLDFEPYDDGLHFAAGAAASGDDVARTVSGAPAIVKRTASTPLPQRAASKLKKA